MSGRARNNKIKYFRFKDFFAVAVFLFIAVLCVDMFRNDLMQTISLQNVEPVGTVIIRKNIVQRRISSRVLWDRLSAESPVYIGDLIRVAEVSEATLYIGESALDLEENTLIRISLSEDGEGIQVSISEGKFSFSSGAGSQSITLDINGSQVKTSPGSVLNAILKENGATSIQVNEGTVKFVDERGLERELDAGVQVSMDFAGRETRERAVVVTQPAPNSRFLNSAREPFTVNFAWNRINLESADMLRLDISPYKDFSAVSVRINNLNNQAQARLESGVWYWRVCIEDTPLSSGVLTIADAGAVELKSPAANSVFRYSSDYPVLTYQWTELEEASSYIFEVSSASNFLNPSVYKRTESASVTDSSLGSGLWYWRVMPVFPVIYNGSAVFSKTGFFSIEQTTAQVIEAANEVSFSQWLTNEAPSSRPPAAVPQEIAAAVMPPAPAAAVTPVPPAPAEPQRAPPVPAQPPAPALLPAAQNLRPARGVSYGFNDLQSSRNIVFRWAAVREANAYIFTLFQQTTAGRQQIVRATVSNGTSYTLSDLSLLDRGTFTWQVEAVGMTGGAIQRRGRTAENTFVIDFPTPRPVQIEDTGILYGN